MQLEDKTRWLLDYLFPDIDKIKFIPKTEYITNNIYWKSIVIYARQSEGKTETARKLVEYAAEKYGVNNVNARIAEEGELDWLLKYGLDDNLIQILFADNLTLADIKKQELRNFFRVRHKWYRLTKRNYGYILSILATHRFFSMPVELRTENHAILFKTSPTSPYDYNFVKRCIGQDGIDFLDSLEMARDNDRELKSISVFRARNKIGLFITPLAKKNYLKDIQIPSEFVYKEILKKIKRR